jgi:2-C-methyl-D-erythritol 2,4-cyclodiphosphate synthase
VRGNARVGLGSDIHRLVEGRPLFMGTVEVPHSAGLLGHSDGDVLAHAVADALLGAAGLGEIGTLFPDTDPRWKGISGKSILESVGERLREAGWEIGNVDSVIHAEHPRLAGYRDAMVGGVAAALRIDASQVSIKIKSFEGLTSLGRGEGIAAQAIARIESTDSLS